MRRPAIGRGLVIAPLLIAAGGALAAGWIVEASDYAVGDAGSDGAATAPPGDATVDAGAVSSLDAQSDATMDARRVADADAAGADLDVDVDADSGAEAAESDADAASSDAGDAAAPVCGQGLPTGQAAFDEIVRTCVLAASCDGYFFPQNISECITEDYLHSTTAFSCLQSIATCADFTACYGYGNATAADCPTGQTVGTCDVANNRAINCVGLNAGAVMDCKTLGGTCAIDDAGTTFAGCVVVPSCSQLDGGSQCSGDALYNCAGGRGFGLDCSNIHATCGAPGSGASCYFDSPPCADAGSACAADGTLGWCTSTGQSLTFRCSSAGLSCSIDDAGAGHCVAPGCRLPSTCTESCGPDGKTITVCVGGAPYAIDCTQYPGFTRCTQPLNTARNLVYARCLP